MVNYRGLFTLEAVEDVKAILWLMPMAVCITDFTLRTRHRVSSGGRGGGLAVVRVSSHPLCLVYFVSMSYGMPYSLSDYGNWMGTKSSVCLFRQFCHHSHHQYGLIIFSLYTLLSWPYEHLVTSFTVHKGKHSKQPPSTNACSAPGPVYL